MSGLISQCRHKGADRQLFLGTNPVDHITDQLVLLYTFVLALERRGCLASSVSKCAFKLQSRDWLSLPQASV